MRSQSPPPTPTENVHDGPLLPSTYRKKTADSWPDPAAREINELEICIPYVAGKSIAVNYM